MPIHPLGKDWRQSLREDRDAFILADELEAYKTYQKRIAAYDKKIEELLKDAVSQLPEYHQEYLQENEKTQYWYRRFGF